MSPPVKDSPSKKRKLTKETPTQQIEKEVPTKKSKKDASTHKAQEKIPIPKAKENIPAQEAEMAPIPAQVELDRIAELELEIPAAKRNINGFVELITILDKATGVNKMQALVTTASLLGDFILDGKLFAVTTAGMEVQTRVWLRERYKDYLDILCHLLRYGETRQAKITSLHTLMYFIKLEGWTNQYGRTPKFPETTFNKIVKALRANPKLHASHANMGDIFFDEYVNLFDDYRYYTMSALKGLLKVEEGKTVHETTRAWVCSAMLKIDNWATTEEELGCYCTDMLYNKFSVCTHLKYHNKISQEAWMALIQSGLTLDERKRILQAIPTKIAPKIPNPEFLLDFLHDSLELGESAQILALSGLWYLIDKKNYDLPNFWKTVYSALTSNMLHSNKRSEFLRVLNTFLSSSHLSAALVASFIKRMARLALFAPPAAITAIVPWIYNLLKRHPACTLMVHREIVDPKKLEEIEAMGLKDPFIARKKNPEKTCAIDSCLWEIATLQQHYHPSVATLAKIIASQFTKQQYQLENFLDDSYQNMLEVELSKKMTRPPAVEQNIPKYVKGFEPADHVFEGDEEMWSQFRWA
ncbi:MAG: hypothetical protein M1814_004021 [Vezdaea aestivalis]|nr:MAG: hypothetical protein M1814_004021 [Vezdaea aestivalis]